MKVYNIIRCACVCMCACVALTGCERVDVPVVGEDGQESMESVKTKKIHFDTKIRKDGMDTRATTAMSLDEVGASDLLIVDVSESGGKSVTKVSKDDALWKDLYLNLTYEKHTVYFVATNGLEYTYDEDTDVLTFSKLSAVVFFCKKEFAVTQTSGSTYSVSMERLTAQCRIIIDDAIPDNLDKVQIRIGKYFSKFDISTQRGVSGTAVTKEVSDWQSSVDKTGEVITFHLLPLQLGKEYTTTITVTMLDSEGTVLASETADDVPFEANYVTTLEGSFFGTDESFNVKCNNQWNQKEVVEI